MRFPSVLLAGAAVCCLVGSLSACGASGSASGGASSATSAPASSSAAPDPTASSGSTTASSIDGRWAVAGEPATAITFAEGAWTASSSCATGAVGGRGTFQVLRGERLVVTRTATPIRGCPVTDDSVQRRATAITAVARAASFRIEGDTLTLFDSTGATLGSLVRG